MRDENPSPLFSPNVPFFLYVRSQLDPRVVHIDLAKGRNVGDDKLVRNVDPVRNGPRRMHIQFTRHKLFSHYEYSDWAHDFSFSLFWSTCSIRDFVAAAIVHLAQRLLIENDRFSLFLFFFENFKIRTSTKGTPLSAECWSVPLSWN